MDAAGRPLERPLALSPDTAWRILSACRVPYKSFRYIAAGATSEAWAIGTGDGRLVLRVAAPRAGEQARYEAEFAIRSRLVALGGKVARPVATNRDVDAVVDVDWCLDEFVEGEPAEGPLPPPACRDLGATLALLHRLPADAHGPLEDRRDRLVGERATARDGILARLERPWPYTGVPLDEHPIATAAPELVARLAALHSPLLALLDGDGAVNHTDLHAGQLPVSGERLAAILDFGAAVVAPPAWDIGSFGYFFGWEQAAQVLEGYTADQSRRTELLEQGRLFAIVIALHHAGRAVTLNQPERMHGALRYLGTNL